MLRERIAADLKAAMKARDIGTVSVLRTLLGALDNAGAVPQTSTHVSTVGRSGDVARRELTTDDERAILESELADRQRARDEYSRHGRVADAERMALEIGIVQPYLP